MSLNLTWLSSTGSFPPKLSQHALHLLDQSLCRVSTIRWRSQQGPYVPPLARGAEGTPAPPPRRCRSPPGTCSSLSSPPSAHTQIVPGCQALVSSCQNFSSSSSLEEGSETQGCWPSWPRLTCRGSNPWASTPRQRQESLAVRPEKYKDCQQRLKRRSLQENLAHLDLSKVDEIKNGSKVRALNATHVDQWVLVWIPPQHHL